MSERISVSRAAREAHKAFEPIQPETTEYERLQKAFYAIIASGSGRNAGPGSGSSRYAAPILKKGTN